MMKKIIVNLSVGISSIFIAIGILALVGSTESTGFHFSYQVSALGDREQGIHAQNNILFYDDDCVPNGNSVLNSGSSALGSSGSGFNIADGGFKIDGSVDALDFWYAEGCLNNGECTGHVYADGGIYLQTNPFLFSATKVDPDFGGLQYIYAENYDIQYENTWPPKFTEKTGPKSTRKYYWIVLPADAYTNGLGETYVAKFENLSEPVYFITFDAHACEHQSQRYCDQAKADPDNVLIGKEFLGAYTQDGGNYVPIANLAGKLTYFHRIAGRGEVLVHESASGGGFAISDNGSSSSSSSGSSPPSGSSQSSASGDFSFIKSAKNANKSVFNTDQYGEWGANWDDGDTASLRRALEAYGDLAYQTGKAIGAPWKAIFVQMRYEDPGSVCGKNNFWGMGCPPGTSAGNGSNYDTLGDGFVGYANYATKICTGAQNVSDLDACRASLKVSNPLQYLKNLGPLWVQGDANGTGYWYIDAIKNSLSKLDAFLATDEGKAIVEKFGNYTGDDSGGCDPTKADYPQYNQQTGHTCGPASMAMLSTVAAGESVTEDDIISIVGSDRAYADTRDGIVDLDKKVGEKYGFDVEGVAVNESDLQSVADKMREYLDKGYMIHFSGEGCTISSTCYAHYVGIFYLDGDTAYIADSSGAPASNRKVNLDKYITGREINPKNNSAGGGFHGGVFSAIKGKNICQSGNSNIGSGASGASGGVSSGIDYCSDVTDNSINNEGSNGGSSGGVNSSINEDAGLTFEQAKAFARKFGEIGNAGAEIVAPATWCYTTSGEHVCSTCKGGPGSDCTAVPYFFTSALTDLNFNSQSTQAGNYAASDIASRANVDRGTTPRVWSVVSAVGVHTWMIVGHHNGKWITVESSCSDNGNGAGTGEYGGGGVAWAAEIPDDVVTTSVFSNMIPKEYAYLDGHVDLDKVSKFISGGYQAIK